jgi:hypothetical protein
MWGGDRIETSFVYRNSLSSKRLLIGITLPLIPLFIYLFVLYLIELPGYLVLVPIVYILAWLVLFIVMLHRIYEVMVVYKNRIVFINPYRERSIMFSDLSLIYYNVNQGISFTTKGGKVITGRFKFDFEGKILEDVLGAISNFTGLTEEHIKDTGTYCLVNKLN